MKFRIALGALVLGAAPALAAMPDGAACAAAGHGVELADALPPNMLLAIGMVESGRANPLTGAAAPWPWTVNVDGKGQYFASKQDAEAYVRLAQTSGARDIDVGCFQVSLEYHPDAFGSLDEAFNPGTNAAYAGTYLTQLKTQTGSWNSAIADYHSASPNLGLPYQRLVLAAWRRLGNLPPDLGAEIAQAAFQAPDPVVVLQSAAARKVHVYAINGPEVVAWRPGLPRVIDNP